MNSKKFFVKALMVSLLLTLTIIPAGLARPQIKDEVHSPAKGTDERKAILDSVHDAYKESVDHPTQFLVNYLKVHNGWAWINVTPLNEKGTPVGENNPMLFNLANGKWVEKDLFGIPTSDDDHVGPLEPGESYVKALLKQYPEVPRDIIPQKKGKK